LKWRIKTSKGIPRAAPICSRIALTKGSKAVFGRPGLAETMSFPVCNPTTAPGPSLMSSSEEVAPVSVAMPLRVPKSRSPVALFTKTVNRPETTAAMSSASV